MKSRFITLMLFAVSSAFVACSEKTVNEGNVVEQEQEQEQDKIERLVFDCVVMAKTLNTDFAAFTEQNTAYKIEELSTSDKFVMAGYVDCGALAQSSKSDNSSTRRFPLTIEVTKDVYGNVGSIYALPDDKNADKILWAYYLENYTKLNLGTWLGAKYNINSVDGTSEGGVYQTVQEALNVVNAYDIDKVLICAVFGVVPGKAYAVPTFEKGRFKVQLVNNFLRLDYDVLYGLIGGDYQAFAAENYIIGSKMSLWGTYYFYCDYCLDIAGNAFNCDVNTDEAQAKIKNFSITIDSKYSPDEQLDIWKQYAAGDANLKLGAFKEAYTSSFNTKGDTFASAQEVLDYVEKKGRPASGFDPDIVVVYGSEKASITITLKSLSLTMKVE